MNENVTKVICGLFVLVANIAFCFISPYVALKIYSLTFAAFYGIPVPNYWMMMALIVAVSHFTGKAEILTRLSDLMDKETPEEDKYTTSVKRVFRAYAGMLIAWRIVWLCVG